MSSCWIAVASVDHVRVGQIGGFMQVCHGKAAPLRRVGSGSRVVYYSPSQAFGGNDRLQAFTAMGVVRPGEPYQRDMGNGFRPFRRDVAWALTQDAPIHPLLERLEFSAGVRNWGQKFRYGLFTVSDRDMDMIAEAMRPRPSALEPDPTALKQRPLIPA